MPDLPLIPGTLPVGYCPADEQARYNKYFALGYAQLAAGTGWSVKVDPASPSVDERINTLWLKTGAAGEPERLYKYFDGYWSSPHPVPASSDFRTLVAAGSEADVWALDGGDGSDPTAVPPTDHTGAMWEVDHTFDFRIPMGAGTNPTAYDGGAATVLSVGGTAGAERHTLSSDEMPAHTHPNASNQFYRWEADGNDGIAGQGEGLVGYDDYSGHPGGPATAYEPVTDSTGGGKSHDSLPPVKGVFLIKRTIRQFYTAA